MPEQLTRKGARNVTEALDRIGNLIEKDYKVLGIPEKVANDYAVRTDLISDAVEITAASNFPLKEAADEEGASVEPDGEGFDANEIADQKAGPLVDEPDEPYMDGEFTQQEFHELGEKEEAGNLAVVAKLVREFGELSTSIGKTAADLPVIPGFVGFTEHIRGLSALADEMEELSAEIEAAAGDLLRKKERLDDEYDAAVSKLRKAVPQELEAQGRIIMERKTGLVEASAILQLQRRKRSLNQVQAELLASVADKYDAEVARFIKTTTAALQDEKKKLIVAFKGFHLEERQMAASKTAGVLSTFLKFRDWLVDGLSKFLRFFATATRLIKGAGSEVESAHKDFMKQVKGLEKAASDDSGFNLFE
jgi:hypothetical protein